MAKNRVSVNDLRKVVSYDPLSGALFWLIRPARNVFVGNEAGTVDGQGYKHFQYKGVIYQCHQVAWALSTGEWASLDIDHKDGDPSNNRLINLRVATVSQNHANRRISKNNTSGVKGVCFKHGKWEASIGIMDGAGKGRRKYRSKYLGRFDNIEDAAASYAKAALAKSGEFARMS